MVATLGTISDLSVIDGRELGGTTRRVLGAGPFLSALIDRESRHRNWTSDSRSAPGPRQMQMPNLLDGLSDVAGGRGQGYGGLAAQ